MSMRALPILFVNLGGEMLYILEQRLRAQSIPSDKARKVLHDIVGTMFNKRFMDELFKPQETYSKKAMRTVFDRLAHASIMRLNPASMDKLYDLMTMAFKYQVSLCLRPKDLLLVTYNHLDIIRSFVTESATVVSVIDNIYRLVSQNYHTMSPGEYQLIRQTLLQFFQDMHIRVSIFLKEKVQNSNGRFVLPSAGKLPYGTEIPGTIRLYSASGAQAATAYFPTGSSTASLNVALAEGSLEVKGDRVTKLGTNMYSNVKPSEATALNHHQHSRAAKTLSPEEVCSPNPLAKEELNLLAHLMGTISETKRNQKAAFKISLFNTEQEEEEFVTSRPVAQSSEYDFKVINIDASKKKQSDELSRIMGDLALPEATADSAGDDLLELMDSAT